MYRICFLFSILCFIGLAEAKPTVPPNAAATKDDFRQLYFKTDVKKQITSTKPPLLIEKGFIILDPGHGGHDAGTQSVSTPRYQEKSLNLMTATFAKEYLQHLGFRVVLTRQDDKYVSLDRRAQFANEQAPDLFISIHYNSAPSTAAKGIEVFYYQPRKNKKNMLYSHLLAESILKNTVMHTHAAVRGIKNGNFAVIRETNMPSILIEGGFLTNEAELEHLKDPIYLKKLAWGIAKGVEEYWEKKKVIPNI
jgi:N-acetylmuramoyl-L-alanine amidase